MSGAEATTRACERFDELELRAANGEALTAAQERFVHEHEASCEVCGALAEGARRVRISDRAPGCRPMDELARRRLVNRIVEGVDRDAPDHGDGGTVARRRGTASRWVVGGAAAAALVVVAAGLLIRSSRETRPLLPDGAAGTTMSRGALGRVVLVSGAVERDDGAARLGDALGPGARLRVSDGRAALVLDRAVHVLLGPGTSVRLLDAPAGQVALRLSSGELIAVVTPGRSPGRLSVDVADARVTVVGTVFAVRQRARGADVAVLRGEVRVDAPGRPARAVASGRLFVLGGARTEALPRTRARALWRRATVLDLLRRGSAARLSLRTHPPGATAVLDGTVLGVTPLHASLKPGHRSLEVRRVGHPTLREHLLLEAGAVVTRDFDVPQAPARTAPAAGGGWRALLDRARTRRVARDWKGSAAAYAELVRAHPARPEARVALVSLGLIQLEHLGRPADALASFSRYLALSPRGALASEALWGQARALRALGRRQQEVEALRRYLKLRGAANDARARRRLRALSGRR